MGIDSFLHRRVGHDAFKICGWARIAFAFLVLVDRALLTVDFEHFFFSGLMPYEATSKDPNLENSYTLLQMFPDSRWFYWTLHLLSMVQAVLLLLGVAPKFQLVCGQIYMISFHYHNRLIWHSEEMMFRVFNFLLLFIPLHRITVFDKFGQAVKEHDKKTDSWPMWPFRMWQLQTCFIYFGAGMGKLANERWRSGVAMYHISHATDFFGGPVTPDFVFNRVGPLMLMTYGSLFIECTCILFIWPKATRRLTLWSILALHLGIELSMNMHCFEWLSLLGWVFFLIEPMNESGQGALVSTKNSSASDVQGRPLSRWMTTGFVGVIMFLFFAPTVPLNEMTTVAPDSVKPLLQTLAYHRDYQILPNVVDPYLAPLGISQTIWNMYCVAPDETLQFEATVHLNNNTLATWKSPDWSQNTWYEKKRMQRPMTYYEYMASGAIWSAQDAFVHAIAQQYGGAETVSSVSLVLHVKGPPPQPNHLGFWDRARQPLSEQKTYLFYTLNVCDDLLDECNEWVDQGGCDDLSFQYEMITHCRKSCHWCHTVDDVSVDARVSLYWELDATYYDATIRAIAEHPKQFLLEWDYFDETDGGRWEWLDVYDLRGRSFRLLPNDEAVATK